MRYPDANDDLGETAGLDRETAQGKFYRAGERGQASWPRESVGGDVTLTRVELRVGGTIAREKQIKGWRREWKVELIESRNPSWRDLYEELFV